MMKLSIFIALALCSFSSSTSAPQVDLGYSTYEGFTNETTNLNIFRGIRFAAPPTGTLRWQPPQAPATTSGVLQATAFPNQCNQAGPNTGEGPVPEADVPTQSEDCLFLDVYAPTDANNLPVLVWIHGGGYGFGNGGQDLSAIISANNNSFVGVSIQYRLGAFGFLSSDEVHRFGVPNAGIRDQVFALEWVQQFVSLFGGNPRQVTISGESAGGGSVMLQAMAFGGANGTALFNNGIAASPYLPMQFRYNGFAPSQSYYGFALKAGCFDGFAVGSPAMSRTIFECLVNTNESVLQQANLDVSTSGLYGTWGFLPVTDGVLIQERPTKQLLEGKVNGLRILSGNNAEEGPIFVPQNITTEDDLVAYLKDLLPLFTDEDITELLQTYPSSNASDPVNPVLFATLGDQGPTAVNQSALAVGQQQRANNIYAETTFVCPSYWLAEAYNTSGFKYQYSVPVAYHSSDVAAYFGPHAPNQSPEFSEAFMKLWGNFITTNIPTIPAIGNGSSITAPAFPQQLNLNETGGVVVEAVQFGFINKTIVGGEIEEPGLMDNFRIVNAVTWEGGRGARCDFWKKMSKVVPE